MPRRSSFPSGEEIKGAPTAVVVVVDVVVVILDYHAAGKVSSVQNCRNVVEFIADFTGELPRFARGAILAVGCKKRSRVRWLRDVSTFLNDDDDRARWVAMRASEFLAVFKKSTNLRV